MNIACFIGLTFNFDQKMHIGFKPSAKFVNENAIIYKLVKINACNKNWVVPQKDILLLDCIEKVYTKKEYNFNLILLPYPPQIFGALVIF